MSKRAFKLQASSGRAASSASGSSPLTFGASQSGFQTVISPLSYIAEQPDLSEISDPRVVVAFKNLGKKDSTTKTKALEELQEHLSAAGQNGIETAVLEAWANLYPRTSIDNSRRVRQLSHTLQGWTTTSSGRRIVPYLPKAIGSWLAGTYDSDKGVARSAQDALQSSFPTLEKREALWKVYRQALIDYVDEALLVQSQQTLSDERTTSLDDSEAKHVRVVSTAALILVQLIERESSSVSAKLGLDYTRLLGNDKLWEYAYHKDPSMRRAIYALILPTVTNLEDYLDFKVISTCFLAKALHINQLGSSGEYVDALLSLTQHRSRFWTTDYTSKTPSSRRLFQFLEKGSQRGPESFWTSLGQLIRIIPVQTWITASSDQPSLKDAEALLEALHEGAVNAEEPRQNISAAWSTYASTALWLIRDMKIDAPQALLEKQVYPIILQHISKSPTSSQWEIPTAQSTQLCSRILVSLVGLDDRSLTDIWTKVTSDIINFVKISLPETSKDFRSSQDTVIARAGRYCKLQEQVTRSIPQESSVRSKIEESSVSIISDCIKILRDRKGKPYGAAGTIAAVLSVLPADSKLEQVDEFLSSDFNTLLASPSGSILISILQRCDKYPSYHACFDRCVEMLLDNGSLPDRDDLLVCLLQEAKVSDLNRSSALAAFVTKSLDSALDGEFGKWKVVKALLGNKAMLSPYGSVESNDQPDLYALILGTMMGSLSIEERRDAALVGFEEALSANDAAASISSIDSASRLLPLLLLAADSPKEDTSKRASELTSRLRSLMKQAGSAAMSSSTFELLRQQFQGTGQLISVFGMVELAEQTLKDSGDAHRQDIFASLLPTAEHWQAALKQFLHQNPPPESAITSPLQGTVHAIDRNDLNLPESIPRDSDDFSIAMRLTFYVTKLLSNIGTVGYKQLESLYLYYPQALQLINAKITIDTSNDLWLNSTPEVIEEAVDVMSKGQKLIRKWVQECVATPDAVKSIVNVWQRQISNMHGTSPQAYIHGLCFNSIMTDYMGLIGPTHALNSWKTEIGSMNQSSDIVQSAALVSVLQEILPGSVEGKKLCNELIADATSLRDPKINVADLRPLILLNMLLHEDNGLISSIPMQRVVFLFQNLVLILSSEKPPPPVQSEIYKLLSCIVSAVSEIYGDYWEQILDVMVDMWEDDDAEENLPNLHSSLWLLSRLRSLLTKEPNEDLIDAWKAKRSSLDAGLAHVLTSWVKDDTGTNYPRYITAESLSRQLRLVDVTTLDRVEGLYPLLGSEQHSVQTAAYELLHRTVPARQEQISIHVALEKQVAHLPAELISLIAPFANLESNRETPQGDKAKAIRTHLLGWALLFDNFTNASFKLKEMYHGDIKNSAFLPTLLDLICEILRITSGRPVDASKLDITSVKLQDHGFMEREAQSLATYLYYISLLHVPDLVKEWFIEQKNRIKSPLESWTQKHISPLIVAASLEAATEWATTQDQDDRPVSIKASPKGSELVASIGIDEESPPISLAISLPGAYPLEQATVTSRNRVGVSDKNWQSWMRTFQIIIFSTGNLIEGLIAFRRNVQGALKGQTECAICYSIIGTDMKTPDKKCGTCKNTFHSVCLFRWFKSSNSSSCPLCRNNFNYA